MANTRAVEEIAISGRTRKKTSVFWSTVPENEQFRNVQVPGVAMESLKAIKKNSHSQKYAEVVQKSKSDSAILNTRNDPLTVNKPAKVGHKVAVRQNDVLEKKKDSSSIFKGAASKDQLANVSSLSESTNSRRASLKNLNIEDKKRVANLIKELAKTGEERELALERLQEERVSFEERLSTVQEEQRLLKEERESLKHRLEKSEKLLKKYESELQDVKTEKDEQGKILKKKLQAQPQSTQTSPLIQTLGKDGTTKFRGFKSVGDIEARETNQPLSTRPRVARMLSGTSQVPVYSNSLFDVKVSNVEHSVSSEQSSEESQRSAVIESGGLHELYLREYSLQLRLQEQQIEIQRQQVQLQQQLQLLQQQQQRGLAQQYQEQHARHPHPSQEQHLTHQRQQQQRQQKLSNESHKQEQPTHEGPKQANQEVRHSPDIDQDNQLLKQPLNEQPFGQPRNWDEQQTYLRQNSETISKHHSPTQQTNFLQKRTPERRIPNTKPKHRSDNISYEHSGPLPRQQYKHDHNTDVVDNSRLRNEDELHGQPQNKEFSYTRQSVPLPSHYHYQQHTGADDKRTRSVEEYHKSRNRGQHDIDSTLFHHQQHHDVTKKKSPGKYRRTNDGKQINFNNNEYFETRSYSPKNHYDINGNLVQDHYPHEYLSDPSKPYSDYDDQTGEECRCYCGYYDTHTRQQHLSSQFDRAISKHNHPIDMPQQAFFVHNQTSPHMVTEMPHLNVEPRPSQTHHKPNRHQHAPDRATSYHQRVLHDPNHAKLPEKEPSFGHHHSPEYHHRTDIRMINSSRGNNHYQFVPHYVTHQHKQERETAFDAAIYQPLQETGNKHKSAGERVYIQQRSSFPTYSQSPPTTQVGLSDYDHLPSDRSQNSRTQMNQDKSHDLLDDYINNHQTAGHYDARSDIDYDPREKSAQQSTKRAISRKVHKERQRDVETLVQEQEVTYVPTSHTVRQLPPNEDENRHPSYSLYKANISHTTNKQSNHLRSSHRHSSSQYSHSSYPNSLVDIVEDLEINSPYEEGYSEETENSTEEPDYNSDEEESAVLDNIFFLKR